jgi:hypothetical protein
MNPHRRPLGPPDYDARVVRRLDPDYQPTVHRLELGFGWLVALLILALLGLIEIVRWIWSYV